MKLTLVFISILSFYQCLSQELFKIVVIDLETKQPIPYVAIQTSKEKGLYTDSKGNAHFCKSNVESTLTFRCIGYKTKQMEKDIIADTIFLEPRRVYLNDVVIKKKNTKPEVVGLLKKSKAFGDLLQPKTELISYIKFKSSYHNFSIEKIHYAIESLMSIKNKTNFSNKTGVLRINLYFAKNEKPDQKFYTSYIQKFSMEENKVIVIDISENLISIPSDGFCVGIEMLGYLDEENKLNNNKNDSFLRIGYTRKNSKAFEKILSYKRNMFSNEEIIPLQKFIKEYYKFENENFLDGKDFQPKIGFTIR